MKNIRFLFFILVLGVTGATQAAAEKSDVLHTIDFTELETAQKCATLKTGIFELDNANTIYGACPFLLGNNRLRLVFAEPLLLSTLKAVYGFMSCVDTIEFAGLHSKDLRKKVEEITLKLRTDAYQKAMYHVNLAQSNALDSLLKNSQPYAVHHVQPAQHGQKQNRLARCFLRLLRR
jgi:hypothetical protein